MELGEKQNFNAIILPSRLMAASNPKVVKWSVNAVEGGNQEVGTISKEGIYQAPRTIPKPRELHICAYTEEVQNKNLFATVIIGDGAPQYKSVHIWSKKLGSSKSDAEPKLRSPHGFGLDKEGNIMIADETGGQVLRFTVDGEFLNVIGNGPGEKPGQFKDPREVRCAPNGEIVVTDSKGDRPRMQIFNHEGDFLRIFAEKGRGPGQILRAHGIGFGPDGTMSITDVDNMRVNIYDYDSGKFLYDFGNWTPYQGMNPGEMNACHGMFVDVNGDMFVNSYYGPVHKFTPEGNIVAVFCHAEPPDGSIYFHNLTGDQWGNIYVMARPAGGAQNTEVENASAETVSVRKYNNNGDFITEWGYSDPKHRETTAAVDDNDVFYGMYVTQDTVVERFVEE
jgi:sugar lactone lactonase YvrE